MQDKRLRLREIANLQGGYFTTRQATVNGFEPRNAPYYVSTGEWIREVHGIYRLAGVPSIDPSRDELHLWLLWTIGRKAEKPRGALAFETALSVFNLSDLIPSKVHISVPRSFKVSKLPKVVSLHHEDRHPNDTIEHDGLRVVRPLVTIIDIMREGRISPEHIERAFKDGIRQGIITLKEIDKADFKPKERDAIKSWLKEKE